MALDQRDIDLAALNRLANAMTFVCGAEHPTTIALKKAVESRSALDIKNAHLLFQRLTPGLRKAALAMISD
jgi:hypothetical protein